MSKVVYHDDFLTPGRRPALASSRKWIRHSPNPLIYARLRPHMKQRLTIREENFGFFCDLAFVDVLGMVYDYTFWMGNPMRRNSASPISCFPALVTTVTWSPMISFRVS